MIALIAIATSHPVWPPKILNTCSLALFTLIAVLGFTLGKNDGRWLATWGGAGVGLILGLVILALVPVMPFTEQFARESVPQAYWSSPTFKKINRVLSAAWGLAIFAIGVCRVAAAAINGHTIRRLPELLLGLAAPAAIGPYMLKFSKDYPDRVTHNQPAAPAHDRRADAEGQQDATRVDLDLCLQPYRQRHQHRRAGGRLRHGQPPGLRALPRRRRRSGRQESHCRAVLSRPAMTMARISEGPASPG